jgi:hypothetical protein
LGLAEAGWQISTEDWIKACASLLAQTTSPNAIYVAKMISSGHNFPTVDDTLAFVRFQAFNFDGWSDHRA